jgi:hypothetical protein
VPRWRISFVCVGQRRNSFYHTRNKLFDYVERARCKIARMQGYVGANFSSPRAFVVSDCHTNLPALTIDKYVSNAALIMSRASVSECVVNQVEYYEISMVHREKCWEAAHLLDRPVSKGVRRFDRRTKREQVMENGAACKLSSNIRQDDKRNMLSRHSTCKRGRSPQED